MQSILENIVANPTASVLKYAMAVDQISQEALTQGD